MNIIEKQQGLNNVVQAKVERMIANRSANVNAMMQRLDRESKLSRDFITPIGIDHKATKPEIIFLEDGNKLIMNMQHQRYNLHSNAVGQLGEKLNIPSKYLRELSVGEPWQKKLAAEILNEHSVWTQRSRVLVRTVGPQVRGVLSDSYRRLNSRMILESFLKAAIAQGGVPCDALMTDTKVYIETILPYPICVPTKLNGEVVVYMGARFSTSDYGDGAVELRAFLLNGVCLNGMVRESIVKQVHLGSKLDGNIRFSDRTYMLDTQTTMSAIEDFTHNLYSTDNIRQKSLEIQAASATEVDFDAELHRLMKGNLLNKSENEGIQKLLMINNPEDGLSGSATLWKLTQSITAYARELAPQRQRELHELSGELLMKASI